MTLDEKIKELIKEHYLDEEKIINLAMTELARWTVENVLPAQYASNGTQYEEGFNAGVDKMVDKARSLGIEVGE